MENVPNLSQAIPLKTFVMLTMYFVLALYAIYTGIFYYHWKSYASNGKVSSVTLLAYGAVTLPLMLTIIGLALLF